MKMVYIIGPKGSGPVKIGHSSNPESRRGVLQVASPEPLEILALHPGDIYTEKMVHDSMSEHRISGEWFRREGRVLLLIENMPLELNRMVNEKLMASALAMTPEMIARIASLPAYDEAMPIGVKLQQCRVRLGLSQRQAAIELGFTERTVNTWESGLRISIMGRQAVVKFLVRHRYILTKEAPCES